MKFVTVDDILRRPYAVGGSKWVITEREIIETTCRPKIEIADHATPNVAVAVRLAFIGGLDVLICDNSWRKRWRNSALVPTPATITLYIRAILRLFQPARFVARFE
jgi:hypothetical protein